MTARYDDWVTIVPAPGEVAETARTLLALATDPRQIRTVNGGAEFSVSPALADTYTAPAPKRRARKKTAEEEVTPDGD